MFLQLNWLRESLEENPEDFENIIRGLAVAELLGQLELVENLMAAVDQWGSEIPKKNIVNALAKIRNDVLEELRNLVVGQSFYSAAMSEIVRTKLTEEIREQARKALEKKEECVKTMVIEEGD